jgi:hypothetical protein
MMVAGDGTGAAAGPPASARGRTIARDDVVALFGTPDQTAGSVNEPVLQVEHGFEFNEKWVYDRPRREPTQPRARVIYWQRYDFVGCVRIERDGQVVLESPSDLLQRRGNGSP